MNHSLSAFLAPRSVAVVGASDNIHKIGGRPIHYMREHGFAGSILPINPSRDVVQGLPCHARLRDVPEPPDLAIVVVAGDAAQEAIEDCAVLGVPAAIVIASGYGEAGSDGHAAQARLMAAAQAGGVRIVGPNSQGLANFGTGAISSFSTMFIEAPPKDGPVAIVSQSGGVSAMVYGMLRRQGIGVRHMHATGNEADVTVSELAIEVLQDPTVQLLLLYMESLKDPEHLAEAARLARARGVPIVAVKAGHSAAGQKAAASHTGALASEDRAVSAFLRKHGIWRVEDAHALAACASVYLHGWQPQGRRVAVLSNSGASCVMAADHAETLGLELPVLQPDTQAWLRQSLPSFAATTNPVDVTAALLTNSGLFGQALPALARDPQVDMLLLDIPVTGMGYDVDRFADDSLRFMQEFDKPIVVSVWQEEAMQAFQRRGVPTAGHTGAALSALAQLASHHELMRSSQQNPDWQAPPSQLVAAAPSHTLSEATSLMLLGGAGAGVADLSPAMLQSVGSLGCAGLPIVEHRLCQSADEAVQAWRDMGASVAVKASSPAVPHKSEHGLVALDCNSEAAVRAAFEAQTQTLIRLGAPCEGVLVARMVKGQREMMLGAHWDPVFGATVLIGDGGKYVESLRDTQLLIAPCSMDEVLYAISRLRIASVLQGVRGESPIDLQALAHSAVALGQWVTEAHGRIQSVDLNPVMASANGVTVVDALVVVQAAGAGS